MSQYLQKNWNKDLNNKKSLRDSFGQAIVKLAEQKKDLVAVTADLTSSTRLTEFKNSYPMRFFQMGVAEQNMIGISAGLALAGFVPFSTSFAVFCPGRCLDQIRVQVCLNNLNVKLVGSHAGLSHPKDGPTAQATEDIAVMRSLPNMTVIYPADFNQMQKAVAKIYDHPGPVYLRMTREPSAVFIKQNSDFEINKAQVLIPGNQLTIISAGPLLEYVLQAASLLEKQNISCEVINLHTIKPIDKKTLIKSVKKTKLVLTVEDHQIMGGLGSAAAEVLSQNYPVKMKMLGLDNCFGKTARNYDQLIRFFKLSAFDIIGAAKNLVRKK
jgi:transketolase